MRRGSGRGELLAQLSRRRVDFKKRNLGRILGNWSKSPVSKSMNGLFVC